ncbi:spermine/spermidine N-acetyltransferase [Chitinophaga niastensis]|uniref:Spermine/spermidine N-acetyltransferase n=1 Tax=Chitinophaga niastensis TaxID=536980 RepID=A0A2P8HA66_CHINA|nr:GNAT family N-acetyltransferase [Chitinophaga niastensis]PSL43091.1 spermine/spermidine N-acetyltransferase [Chitinophaga niastensis]
MNSILIVPAITAEVELLQQIGKQSFLETYAAVNTVENMEQYLQENFSIQNLTAEMTNPNSEFHFAMLNTQAIGYIKLNFKDAQTDRKNWQAIEIERIYVLKAFQGKKVGQQLFERALEIARQARAPYLWLGVWEKNTNAIGFYKRNGLVEFGTHTFTLGTDEQTDLLLKIDLPLSK